MLYRLARPLLFRCDPERMHRLALRTLKVWGRFPESGAAAQGVKLMGLRFPNRVGMAAGFDKNAEVVAGLGRLGFGFVEIGTVTPRPQPGQAKPRLFRVPESVALINRLGFPSEGAEVVLARLQHRQFRGIIGVNIGKNADTPLNRAMDDYLSCLRTLHGVADYIAVNISSPNTASLRDLHAPERLEPLLSALLTERDKLQRGRATPLPVLLKVSPDLDAASLENLARVAQQLSLDGIIATNTTIQREGRVPASAPQPGGVSGRPVHALALQTVAALRKRVGPAMPIIGVGGIESAATARAMREAGADLIQLYSGLVYRGPSLVRECVRAMDP